MVSRGAQGRAESRSSSSRRGAGDSSSRRTSASSATSEEEQRVVVAAPPSPRCVKRRDFKAQGRARSRAKNLRRMEGGGGLGADLVAGGLAGVIGEAVGGPEQCRAGGLGGEEGYDGRVGVTEQPFILTEAYTVGHTEVDTVGETTGDTMGDTAGDGSGQPDLPDLSFHTAPSTPVCCLLSHL